MQKDIECSGKTLWLFLLKHKHSAVFKGNEQDILLILFFLTWRHFGNQCEQSFQCREAQPLQLERDSSEITLGFFEFRQCCHFRTNVMFEEHKCRKEEQTNKDIRNCDTNVSLINKSFSNPKVRFSLLFLFLYTELKLRCRASLQISNHMCI